MKARDFAGAATVLGADRGLGGQHCARPGRHRLNRGRVEVGVGRAAFARTAPVHAEEGHLGAERQVNRVVIAEECVERLGNVGRKVLSHIRTASDLRRQGSMSGISDGRTPMRPVRSP